MQQPRPNRLVYVLAIAAVILILGTEAIYRCPPGEIPAVIQALGSCIQALGSSVHLDIGPVHITI
jgi:hypothetical protein